MLDLQCRKLGYLFETSVIMTVRRSILNANHTINFSPISLFVSLICCWPACAYIITGLVVASVRKCSIAEL